MRPKISLAIIVKNVEKTLDRCLSSFSPCVDEIILVDTGSVDKTVEIAEKYTDKIFHFEWVDDFSAARNYSFDQCTGEFILWCDGDDYILLEDVEKFKAYDFSAWDIVTFPYVYAHDEFGAPALIIARERVIRRSLNLKWQEKIHEYLPLDGLKLGVSSITTQHNKQHGTSERNLSILKKVTEKDPTPRNLYYLARELADFGEIEKAIKRFQQYLALGQGFWENIFQAHYKIANCYLFVGNEAKFKEHIFKSIEMEDQIAEPFYYMGLFFMNKGLFSRAIPWYKHCLAVTRPDSLLSSYQLKYYTWLPHLNLCLCYNSIGKIDEALKHTEKVLEYRPSDFKALNNKALLIKALKSSLKNGEGKKLHLGCGNKRIDGYVNVDLFKGSAVDEVFSLSDIPYEDSTINAIYSEHSLEHVPFKEAEEALREWFRVLKPGGEVDLYMPDFEECCKSYINATFASRYWFKATIYGIQKSQSEEPDNAQIHMCGFSKEEIRIVLERHGFEVLSVENYGGPGQKPSYGTPSMVIKAKKPGGKVKIGWVSSMNSVAAQTRIRVLRVNDWLNLKGFDSSITDLQGAINSNYDIVIVGKRFDQECVDGVKKLKKLRKEVYCDLCEDILEFPFVSEVLRLCDKVICCSRDLSEKVELINPNVVVIEDAYEI